MDPAPGERDQARADALIAWLGRRRSARCADCGAALCAHELLFASALGRKRDPCCSRCLARDRGEDDPADLRAHLLAHFARRACYRAAWRFASEREPRCALGRLRARDDAPA